MSLSVMCEECGASLKVADDKAGQKVKCRDCGAAVSVPGGKGKAGKKSAGDDADGPPPPTLRRKSDKGTAAGKSAPGKSKDAAAKKPAAAKKTGGGKPASGSRTKIVVGAAAGGVALIGAVVVGLVMFLGRDTSPPPQPAPPSDPPAGMETAATETPQPEAPTTPPETPAPLPERKPLPEKVEDWLPNDLLGFVSIRPVRLLAAPVLKDVRLKEALDSLMVDLAFDLRKTDAISLVFGPPVEGASPTSGLVVHLRFTEPQDPTDEFTVGGFESTLESIGDDPYTKFAPPAPPPEGTPPEAIATPPFLFSLWKGEPLAIVPLGDRNALVGSDAAVRSVVARVRARISPPAPAAPADGAETAEATAAPDAAPAAVPAQPTPPSAIRRKFDDWRVDSPLRIALSVDRLRPLATSVAKGLVPADSPNAAKWEAAVATLNALDATLDPGAPDEILSLRWESVDEPKAAALEFLVRAAIGNVKAVYVNKVRGLLAPEPSTDETVAAVDRFLDGTTVGRVGKDIVVALAGHERLAEILNATVPVVLGLVDPQLLPLRPLANPTAGPWDADLAPLSFALGPPETHAALEERGAVVGVDPMREDRPIVHVELRGADLLDLQQIGLLEDVESVVLDLAYDLTELEELRGCKNLRRLSCTVRGVRPEDFDVLRTLPKLEFVRFESTEALSEGLPRLARVGTLRYLGFVDVPNFDELVPALQSFGHLKWLDLRLANPSEAAVRRLRAQLPNATILTPESDGAPVAKPPSPSGTAAR